jgi:ketosteroid isomerase-like protein
LEVVRAIYEAWGRGDYSGTDWLDPEMELVDVDGPEPASAKGVAEVAALWAARLRAFDNFTSGAEEIRSLGDGVFLVLLTNTGRGKSSGLEVGESAMPGVNVVHMRAGRILRLYAYWNRERALADLGLAPGGGRS